MSSIIEFFVAPDDEVAAGVVRGGPGKDLKQATYGNFDVWTTLVEWESILLDRDVDELIDTGGPDVVAHDDGILVLGAPPQLTTALAEADEETLGRVIERWVALRAEDDEDIEAELANDLVREVASLAVDAEGAKGSLYCWVC